MNELDVQEAQAVAGGLLNLFLFTLLGPSERPPSVRDSMAEDY